MEELQDHSPGYDWLVNANDIQGFGSLLLRRDNHAAGFGCAELRRKPGIVQEAEVAGSRPGNRCQGGDGVIGVSVKAPIDQFGQYAEFVLLAHNRISLQAGGEEEKKKDGTLLPRRKRSRVVKPDEFRCILTLQPASHFKAPAMSAEKSPRMYDSMAQAFHLIGKHEEAVDAQEMAIHFLGDEDGTLREEMSQRLLKYTEAAEENAASRSPMSRVESK